MCYWIPLVAGAIWEMSVAMFQGLQETSALNVLAGLGVVGLLLGSALRTGPVVVWPWVLGCALFIADDHALGF